MPNIALDPSLAAVIPDPVSNPANPLSGIANGITLGQARSEIIAMLKGRTDIEPERIDFWLNRAYVDVATSIARMDELKVSIEFDTVSDQPLYLLPEWTVITLAVSRLDSDTQPRLVPMRKIDLTAYRSRRVIEAEDAEGNEPMEFFRYNRILVLYPTPFAAHEIYLDMRIEPNPLTDDSHQPILRPEWHEAWLTLARKKILSALTEFEASIAVGNELTTHLRMRQDNEANEEENRVVSSSRPRSVRELLHRRGSTTYRREN